MFSDRISEILCINLIENEMENVELAAGGDLAVVTGAVHIEKTASETWDHTVSSYQVTESKGWRK